MRRLTRAFEGTGNELWLDRVQATYGRGRYSLWAGDLGTALYLQSCLDVDAAFPTLDVF